MSLATRAIQVPTDFRDSLDFVVNEATTACQECLDLTAHLVMLVGLVRSAKRVS